MIKDLKLNAVISDDFLLDKCEIATTAAGKQYGRLVLSDASGEINAMLWENVQQIAELHSGQIVHAQFVVTQYQNALQAKLSFIAPTDQSNAQLEKFIASSRFDCNEMLVEIIEIAKTIEDPWLSKLVHKFYSDSTFLKKFRAHPAAVSIHHAYCGGLLQHTLNVTRLARMVAKNYDCINVDLVTVVALLHDIGKLHEIQSLPAHDFTDNGNFIGHVVESQNMIRDACREIEGFPDQKRDLICHCILAHHGELEYGSPVKPAVIEAFIVNACDNIDAKTEIFYTHLHKNEAQLKSANFTGKNNILGTKVTDANLY